MNALFADFFRPITEWLPYVRENQLYLIALATAVVVAGLMQVRASFATRWQGPWNRPHPHSYGIAKQADICLGFALSLLLFGGVATLVVNGNQLAAPIACGFFGWRCFTRFGVAPYLGGIHALFIWGAFPHNASLPAQFALVLLSVAVTLLMLWWLTKTPPRRPVSLHR